MTRAARIYHSIHIVSLAIWLGVVLMTGVAAAVIFPLMKGLAPTLPAYSAYTGEHWRIAGGQVANRLFTIADVVQFAAFFGALLTLVGYAVTMPSQRRARMTLGRGVMLNILLVVLAYNLFVLAPRMDINLRGFWESAAAGLNADAETFRARFDADHPTASTLMRVTAILVLFTLLLATWAGAGTSSNQPAATGAEPASDSPPDAAPAKVKLEAPRLARQGIRR